MENNFPILSDITIKNGIDKLRGQGMESGWPALLDRMLFNKSLYIVVGFIHWSSHLNPAIYFGQFDATGKMNFSQVGAWAKVLIIPAILGFIYLIKKQDKSSKLLLLLFLIITFPSVFTYPNLNLELIVLTLPFMAIIIAYGMLNFQSKKLIALLGILIILEVTWNVYNLSPEYKNTNNIRPGWLQRIVVDVYQASKENSVAISDDIVPDMIPFISWYTPIGKEVKSSGVDWPYKYRQYNISNIEILPSDKRFHTCNKDEELPLFVSKRDLEKIQRELKSKWDLSYKDNLGEDKIYLVTKDACIN